MQFKKILIRMPNWLGDFVMATPILHEIKLKYPRAKISVMCKEPLHELLKDVNDVLSFKEISIFSKDRKEIIQEIKKREFDLAILLTNSFSSAYIFWKAKIPNILGYSTHFRKLFMTMRKKFEKRDQTHLVDTYKYLLTSLDIFNTSSLPEIYLDEKEIEKCKKYLFKKGYNEGKRIIGINPIAAYGPAKCWPLENFHELSLQLLKDENNFLLFFGDKKGAVPIQSITQRLNERAIDLSNKTTLRQLCAFMKTCDIFLTNDSGPMHLAAALKVPLIALFGSTNPVITGPYKWGQIILKRTKCSPCYKRECPKEFECMKSISVSELLNQIKAYAKKVN